MFLFFVAFCKHSSGIHDEVTSDRDRRSKRIASPAVGPSIWTNACQADLRGVVRNTFFLITAVCLARVFSFVAEGATILPSSIDTYARKAVIATAWLLGKQASSSNRVKQVIATYLHAAGIQAGYTFFAPNVPSHHRLTLELFYGDGHVEYELPRVHGKAAALRLDSLLDKLPEDVTSQSER